MEEYKRADRLGLMATIITIVLGLAVLVAAAWCIADLIIWQPSTAAVELRIEN